MDRAGGAEGAAPASENDSESPAGFDEADDGTQEPAPKRVRGPGVGGPIKEIEQPAYIEEQIRKALKHLQTMKEKTGADFGLVVAGDAADVPWCKQIVSPGLVYLTQHVNFPQACEIARARRQADGETAELQYGPEHKPFSDCTVQQRRQLVNAGLNALVHDRKGCHPYSAAAARAEDAAAGGGAGEQQQQQQEEGEAAADAEITRRQLGIAYVRRALREACPWYPKHVPYASPLGKRPQLTEADLAQLFYAMAAAATEQQLKAWLKGLQPAAASCDSELDKLYLEGALYHQQAAAAAEVEAAAGGPQAAPSADAAPDGRLALEGVSAGPLAFITEEGTPCSTPCRGNSAWFLNAGLNHHVHEQSCSQCDVQSKQFSYEAAYMLTRRCRMILAETCCLSVACQFWFTPSSWRARTASCT